MTTAIVPTIENTSAGLIVTSETFAHGAGVEHRAVLQLIEKHKPAIEAFGPTAFEMRSQDRGGHKVRTALLNEQQSTLLMMFMRNTPQVIAFKIALVRAFVYMTNKLKSPTGSQEVLFTDDTHGIRIGKPVAELPAQQIVKPFNPRTARNDKIAQVSREAKGTWVPVFIDKMTPKNLEELKKGIRYGHRTSFPVGEFDAEIRNETLYIRHNTAKEITA